MNDIPISMVNTRGRVVWVDQVQLAKYQSLGWKIIVNPKEKYYPQYDQSIVQEQPVSVIHGKTQVVDGEEYQGLLGIIVI